MKPLLLALTLALTAPVLPVMAAPVALEQQPFMIADYDADTEADLNEGKQALDEGNYEQALSSFQSALSRVPDDKKIKGLVKEAETKACAFYVKQGHEFIAQKQYNDATNSFENALNILPEDADAKKGKQLAENWPKADNYIKEAKARMEKHEYEHAVAYLQKAYDLVGDPEVKKLLDEAKAKRK